MLDAFRKSTLLPTLLLYKFQCTLQSQSWFWSQIKFCCRIGSHFCHSLVCEIYCLTILGFVVCLFSILSDCKIKLEAESLIKFKKDNFFYKGYKFFYFRTQTNHYQRQLGQSSLLSTVAFPVTYSKTSGCGHGQRGY